MSSWTVLCCVFFMAVKGVLKLPRRINFSRACNAVGSFRWADFPGYTNNGVTWTYVNLPRFPRIKKAARLFGSRKLHVQAVVLCVMVNQPALILVGFGSSCFQFEMTNPVHVYISTELKLPAPTSHANYITCLEKSPSFAMPSFLIKSGIHSFLLPNLPPADRDSTSGPVNKVRPVLFMGFVFWIPLLPWFVDFKKLTPIPGMEMELQTKE